MYDYDVGLVCLNGHEINASSQSYPESNAKFCNECGEPTINACPKCNATIRGLAHDELRWEVPKHCHECGTPYPWTERKKEALTAAIDELDELEQTERDRLKESIPDVLQETLKTGTAIVRFKKAISKAGTIGGKLLTDILIKVAAEVVVRSMQIK